MASTIKLFCLVDGGTVARAFSVKVSLDDSIDDLKNLIKSQKTNDFSDIDADKLTLWKVSILVDPASSRKPVVLEEIESKEELLPTSDLSDVFEDKPLKNTIHILVHRPLPVNVDPSFKLVVRDVSLEPIPWKANPSTVTVEQFLSDIQIALPNLHRERRNIAIEHTECSHFPNGGVVHLSSDRHLQDILKVYVRANIVTVVVHVVFISKGFSSFRDSDITARLGTDNITQMELGKIDCSFGKHLEASKKLLIAIGLARDSIAVSNEACTTRFSGVFLMAAIIIFPGLQLVPEKTISGTWGTGPVDYLVESRNAPDLSMVGVAEAKKRTTFLSGFSQNVAQLEATLTTRMKQDCRSNGKCADLFSYGIVTDSCRWQFIECKIEAASTTGISQQLVLRQAFLPIEIDYTNDEKWECQVLEVFEYVVWWFEKMSQSVISSKRMKDAREP